MIAQIFVGYNTHVPLFMHHSECAKHRVCMTGGKSKCMTICYEISVVLSAVVGLAIKKTDLVADV